jgi:regulator of protease activity HflC (stomatin/prohibitin superfamily)
MNGPLAQSVGIGVRVLQAALLLLVIAWACSNIRQVPPDSRAIVLRFGRVQRVQDAGLVLSWPRPIETVAVLPARDREIELKMETGGAADPSSETDFQIRQPDDVVQLRAQKDTWNAGYFLTGDGSVVQLDATCFYSISNPEAFFLAREHVEPALQRIYRASALSLAATRDLDDFLVARPERASLMGLDPSARRQRIAGDLARAMNARLQELAAKGADYGVEVRRIDVVAMLPPVAKSAFDAVLTVTQTANQQAAAARTEAATLRAQSDRDRDQVLSGATAAAQETVARATAATAAIHALSRDSTDPAHRQSVLAEYYREQIGAILAQAGQVTTVDPRNAQHLILPGPLTPPTTSAGRATP